MSETIDRTVQLTEEVSSGDRRVCESAQHLDVHRSPEFRRLQTLGRAEFLVRRSDGSRGVGVRLIATAEQAPEALDLPRTARPTAAALRARVGTTVHHAHLAGDRVVHVDELG